MQMISVPTLGLRVSRLGFGAMRLPTKEIDGKQSINREEAIAMIRRAIDQGVNYVDTAYPYHYGESELVVGDALQNGYREKVLLATKLPAWQVETRQDMDRLLEEQLRKLKTDYIDFYLLHSLSLKTFEKMQKLDYPEFLDKAVNSGKIRFPSFSFHDNKETFLKIVDDYPWKMAQIQMNLLDDENQATLEGMHYAAKKGIAIVLMEPLRGGALATPPAEVQKLYDAFPVHRSSVEWAFRYLYSMPEVMTILSGMSTMEQVEDNLRIFSAEAAALTAEETALLEKVKAAYKSRIKTGCTGCSYCQPCPKGVLIPDIFEGYDSGAMLDQMPSFWRDYEKLREAGNDAASCVACGLCQKACPQQLTIISLLKKIRQAQEQLA